MAYEKGVNVNVLAESGQTDEETIMMYENKIPGMTLALKGDEKLNEMILTYENEQNKVNIKQRALDEGQSEEQATKISDDRAGVLYKNALDNYEKLKKQRK